MLTCIPALTNFGDEFHLNNPLLGGQGIGRSPLFGNIRVQFGSASEGYIPYMVSFHAASSHFERKLIKLLQLLPPGSEAGLIGRRGNLHFPSQWCLQSNLSLNSDPQKLSIG